MGTTIPAIKTATAIFFAAAVVAVQGCGTVGDMLKPGVDAQIKATQDVNPDASGRPSPIVVRVYELKTPSTFETADFFTLYEKEAATLGSEMLARDEIALKPGEVKTLERKLQDGTQHIGVLAAYRNIDQAHWRATYKIDGRSNAILIEVGKQAVSISKRWSIWVNASMASGNKVIWSEGLFLRPHHFQQQDRYIESLIEARITGLEKHAWGITSLEIDQNLLTMGKLSLAHASGVLPDGTAFDIPTVDEPPPPLEVPENVHNELVYLALPVKRPGAPDTETAESPDPMARYYPREVEIRDANAGEDSTARVQVGKLQLRLMRESEDRSDYAPIGVARISESRSDSTIALDETFIPPCLDYQAVPKLHGFINELQGMLRHRAESLAGRITDPGSKGVAEVADFMLLQTVNRLEPLITHLARTGGLHPEALYRYLVQMVGELATFTTKGRRPAELPTYRHDDLQATYEPVMAALREALSMVAEQHAVSMPLQERKYGIRVAPISDRSLLDEATFVLAAKANVSAEVVRSRFPTQVKIGPAEDIRQMVNAQLPGIALRPLPVAPRQIPYHSGFTYFELDRSGQYWERLKNSGGFAVHVAGDFPGLELEFWAIRE